MNDTDTERLAAILKERSKRQEMHTWGDKWRYDEAFQDVDFLLSLVSQLQARAEEQGREVERLKTLQRHQQEVENYMKYKSGRPGIDYPSEDSGNEFS